MDKKQKGGKRTGAGRKASIITKRPITVYIEETRIEGMGGKKATREAIHCFINAQFEMIPFPKDYVEVKGVPFASNKTNTALNPEKTIKTKEASAAAAKLPENEVNPNSTELQNNEILLPGGLGNINTPHGSHEIKSVLKRKDGAVTLTLSDAKEIPPMPVREQGEDPISFAARKNEYKKKYLK